MLVDQLFTDTLDFIRRWLFFWDNQRPQPRKLPFQKIRSFQIPHRGQLDFVIGRDTPRAVRTWVFSPLVPSSSDYLSAVRSRPRDLHFYLDECRTLTAEERSQLGMSPRRTSQRTQPPRRTTQFHPRKTHTILILKASHFLNAEGRFEVAVIYQGDFDFTGDSGLSATGAINARTTIDLAAKLGACRHIPDLSWPEEIAQIYAYVRNTGASYPHTQAYRLFSKFPNLDRISLAQLITDPMPE